MAFKRFTARQGSALSIRLGEHSTYLRDEVYTRLGRPKHIAWYLDTDANLIGIKGDEDHGCLSVSQSKTKSVSTCALAKELGITPGKSLLVELHWDDEFGGLVGALPTKD